MESTFSQRKNEPGSESELGKEVPHWDVGKRFCQQLLCVLTGCNHKILSCKPLIINT